VSDRLKQSLMASRTEIEAGLAEAEAELAKVRQRVRELEDLIALGTATLLAAEMISGGARSAPAPAAPAAPAASAAFAAPAPAGNPSAAADLAAAHEKSKDELQSRLSKAQK
jgi:hypothetical protein